MLTAEASPCRRAGDPHSAGQPSSVLTAAAVEGRGSLSAGQPSFVLTAEVSPCRRMEHAQQCKQAYRNANNLARKAVLQDKRQHWRQIAAKLEILFKKGNLHEAYKQVHLQSDTAGQARKMPDNMRGADGHLVVGKYQNAQLKKEYFANLLNVKRAISPDFSMISPSISDVCVSDAPPSLEETREMVCRLKNHKASGICNISAEVLKDGGECIVRWLHEIIVEVWNSGEAPPDWKKALIVPVFKSGDASMLNNYRGISLLSVPAKLYSMLIGDRIKEWVESELLEVQYGFRAERGCMDAIFGLKRLHEEAFRKDQGIFTCFIDLSKAYDSIDRNLAWEVFEKRGLSAKIVALLRDLHKDTQCAMRGDHKSAGSWFEVQTGFKQGDVNAPMLFNLFIDTVVRCLQPKLMQSGVRFMYRMDGHLRECKGRTLEEIAWVLMYADDIALVTETEQQMQSALEAVDQVFTQWGLEINAKKTQVMPLGKLADSQKPSIMLERGQIESVEEFKYLGSINASSLSMQPELSSRLKKAGHAFHKLSKFWKDRYLARDVKLAVYKTVVQATLLYACETWAVPKAMLDSLESFQMRCLRKICSLSLLQRVRNDAILDMCKMETVHNLVSYRRLRWLGHLARMEDTRLPKQLLFHQMKASKQNVGRPIKSWLDYVREDLMKVKLAYSWYKEAQKRDTWREQIQTILVHT